jgi:hypothetical protein
MLPPRHSAGRRKTRTRANLLLLVIALGWSIYAAFSLLWNQLLMLIGSINVIEVVASLGFVTGS